MLLGWVVERVSGRPLERFCSEAIFVPLGACPLGYIPHGLAPTSTGLCDAVQAIAPTEEDSWRGRILRGEVHDENAYALGGWPVMPDCSALREHRWRLRGRGWMVAGRSRVCCRPMWLVCSRATGRSAELQLGAGLGYPIGPILVRDTIFPRVVWTSWV